ncbi:CapA family protein [Pengzhenrongella sicca]|uniref:CapA family protein n=1 Tax=Pengzhenrongella sicca TaxID=2819238 RepID=A0A8A4ZC78_9MICO|nr:CapA family protein [Pengzhenrongella sicca]QTE29021.1 CapA family protein [Pengzhenrongella sicca]
MSTVIVAGDLFLRNGFAPGVSRAVRDQIAAADHALVNLEGPVTARLERLSKSGPHLTMPATALDRVRDAGFTGVTLANNHILDAGLGGLADTLADAAARGLATVGAGTEPAGARDAARIRLPLPAGWLTVLNYCEHEWSVRADGAGASGWDVLDARADVVAARAAGDAVLVILHGGNEYFPLPRPGLRRELRFLAESGADAIVMHHSHVPGAYEVWAGVPIFYGLGNFQFTAPSTARAWREGLLVSLTFSPTDTRFAVVPLRQTDSYDVRLATATEAAETRNELEGYRLQVGSDEALTARWEEFAADAAGMYARGLLPTRPFRGHLGRAAQLARARLFWRDPDARMIALNYVRCESHLEAMRTALQLRSR